MKKLFILFFYISFSFLNAQQTVEIPIIDGNDDAFSNSVEQDEIVYVDTDSLAVARLGSPNRIFNIGLRYQSVPIPPGSTIDSAFIQFSPYKANEETHVVKITCEKNVNPEAFTAQIDNIRDRPLKYQDFEWWVEEWDWIADHRSRTHDIKDLVQYVIDMEGWETYNSMVFIFEGERNPTNSTPQFPKLACSYEYGAEWYAPRLIVSFTAPAAVDEEELGKSLNIFPNPVRDRFTISFEELKEGEYTISMFDLQGRRVHEAYRGLLTKGDHQFSLSANELKLDQGIYLLSIHSSIGEISRKFIVR